MISAWAPLLRPGSRPCPEFGDRVGAVFKMKADSFATLVWLATKVIPDRAVAAGEDD
jgi:hypothetical protein